LIDVQQEYFDGILQIQYPPREESLKNICRALDVAEREAIPIVVVQHQFPQGAPVFAAGSSSWDLHPRIQERVKPEWKRLTKHNSSVFSGTGLTDWLAERKVNCISAVGFMTNNCDLATAAGAEDLGLTVEVLSDASGAIHLANDLGSVTAKTLHETLLVLLHSNFAAVASTEAWINAVEQGTALPKSDLGTSALQGRQRFSTEDARSI
jgi:nicotinamidase-related amidase